MLTNSILEEIRTRELAPLASASAGLSEVELEERARKQIYYDECTHELAGAVQQLIYDFEQEKNYLPDRYGVATLGPLRQRCYAIAETFYSHAENKRHPFYRYMARNTQRRSEALKVRSKAMEVVKYLDNVAQGGRKYQQAEVAMKLFELITALSNLDPTPG